MQTLLHDLKLYRALIGMQIRAQAQYKVNLLIDISTFFFTTTFEFLGLLVIFSAFPSMLGWRLGEVLLLSTLVSLGFGLAEMIGAGIDDFSDTIRLGQFDRVLLRPVGVFTQVIGSDFRLRRLGRLIQGLLTFVVALCLLPDLHWTVLKVLLLPIAIASGSTIYVSILLLGATMCFWTVETTELTNILTYGSRQMLSYPITIYHELMQRFFLFVVPLAFGTFVPVCYLLDRPLPFGLPAWIAFTAPLVALLFAGFAGVLWGWGVRHYQSTGN